MSRRRPSGGDGEQDAAAFAGRGHAGVVSPAVTAAPPPELLFDCSVVESGTEAVVMMSPTSILQTAAVSPTSPVTTCVGSGSTAVPFSRSGGGSGERRSKSQRPWEAKHVGLGLVGALNREAPDEASTVVTGQIKPCSPAVKMTCDTALSAYLSPREMDTTDDYTRVTAGGASRFLQQPAAAAAGGCTDDFLMRCHGCSKELGQGRDIFMYRGERAFCSRECRYREMLHDDGGTEF